MKDAILEQAIDDAGRDKVFALAQANGWTLSMPPPKWVWWQIIREVERQPHDRTHRAHKAAPW